MRAINETADRRQHTWCIYCGCQIAEVSASADHVPSRILLVDPLPENLPTIPACDECNNGVSRDEEYFSAFLSATLSGTSKPDEQINEKAAKILTRQEGLRASIEASRIQHTNPDGVQHLSWKPEIDRISRVITKNARGHAFFELSEPKLDAPDTCDYVPLSALSESQRKSFESVEQPAFWPEVGSRMMTRIISGIDMNAGWVIVQPGIYRYNVTYGGGVTVKSVIWDYLATATRWEE
jgi:hypothetical protein